MSSMKEIAIREYIARIDFKRDDWKMSFNDGHPDFKPWNPRSKIYGWYKENL